MRLQRLRLEFRMELAAQKVWMVRDLYDLHVSSVRGGSCDAQTATGKHRFIFTVELIAMAMALTDLRCAVSFRCLAVRLQFASPSAQPHGAAQFVNAGQFAQLINNAVRRGLV